MSKVLYFLVFMAVIAQIYTVPAPAADDAASKGVAGGVGDQVKQEEDKAMKVAGSAGSIPKSAIGSAGGMVAPLFEIPKKVMEDGEKVENDFMGMLMGGM